jgi:hypothetical protein
MVQTPYNYYGKSKGGYQTQSREIQTGGYSMPDKKVPLAEKTPISHSEYTPKKEITNPPIEVKKETEQYPIKQDPLSQAIEDKQKQIPKPDESQYQSRAGQVTPPAQNGLNPYNYRYGNQGQQGTGYLDTQSRTEFNNQANPYYGNKGNVPYANNSPTMRYSEKKQWQEAFDERNKVIEKQNQAYYDELAKEPKKMSPYTPKEIKSQTEYKESTGNYRVLPNPNPTPDKSQYYLVPESQFKADEWLGQPETTQGTELFGSLFGTVGFSAFGTVGLSAFGKSLGGLVDVAGTAGKTFSEGEGKVGFQPKYIFKVGAQMGAGGLAFAEKGIKVITADTPGAKSYKETGNVFAYASEVSEFAQEYAGAALGMKLFKVIPKLGKPVIERVNFDKTTSYSGVGFQYSSPNLLYSRGFEYKAKGIIGVIDEGGNRRVVIGTPTIKPKETNVFEGVQELGGKPLFVGEFNAGKRGIRPESPLQTAIVDKTLEKYNPSSIPIKKDSRTLMGILETEKSQVSSKEYKLEVEALTEKEKQAATIFLEEVSKTGKYTTKVEGSSYQGLTAGKVQDIAIEKGVRSKPGDFDVRVKEGSEGAFAKELAEVLSKADNRKFTLSDKGDVVLGKEAISNIHGFDGNPFPKKEASEIGLDLEMTPEKTGSKFELEGFEKQTPTKIGEVYGDTLGFQNVRKGGTSLALQEKGVAPPVFRLKDPADFVYITAPAGIISIMKSRFYAINPLAKLRANVAKSKLKSVKEYYETTKAGDVYSQEKLNSQTFSEVKATDPLLKKFDYDPIQEYFKREKQAQEQIPTTNLHKKRGQFNPYAYNSSSSLFPKVKYSKSDLYNILPYSPKSKPSYNYPSKPSYPSKSYPSKPSYPSKSYPSKPSYPSKSYPSRPNYNYPSKPSYSPKSSPGYPSGYTPSYSPKSSPSYPSKPNPYYPSYPSKSSPSKPSYPSKPIPSYPSRPNFNRPPIEPPVTLPNDDFKKSQTKEKQGPAYNAYAKQGGKYIKVNQEPLTRTGALALMQEVVDNTSSATGRIKETVGKAKESMQGMFSGYKFKQKNNTYQEKNTYRIDTQGEHEGITVKGWLAKKRKRYVGL